jgi:predicted N-formylglutamate amidohydrolase
MGWPFLHMEAPMLSLGDAVRHVNSSWEPALAAEARHALLLLKCHDDRIKVELDDHGFAVFHHNKDWATIQRHLKTSAQEHGPDLDTNTFVKADNGLVFVILHNGSYTPDNIPFLFDGPNRKLEEDIHTLELYLPLFLEHGGTLVLPFASRYFVDLNRPKEYAVLNYGTQNGQPNFDKDTTFPEQKEVRSQGLAYYRAFYAKLSQFLNQDSIVFSGHSMRAYDKDAPTYAEAKTRVVKEPGKRRGQFCLIFHDEDYEDAVQLQKLMADEGLIDIRLNEPYNFAMHPSEGSGNLGVWAQDQGVRRVFEFETSKDVYLLPNMLGPNANLQKVAKQVQQAVSQYISHLHEQYIALQRTG